MTFGRPCPIYYRGVVSVETGNIIIRYKLAELIKRVSYAGNPTLPQPRFKYGYGGE